MIIFRPGVDETRQMETGYWQNAYYRVSMLILEQINSNAISRTQEPTQNIIIYKDIIYSLICLRRGKQKMTLRTLEE